MSLPSGPQTLPASPCYDIDHWMVGWNSAHSTYGRKLPGVIEVGPFPDNRGWSDKYSLTSGCCNNRSWMNLTIGEKRQHLLGGFLSLTLCYGLAAEDVHREFWKIKEWRKLNPGVFGEKPDVFFRPDGRCDPYNE